MTFQEVLQEAKRLPVEARRDLIKHLVDTLTTSDIMPNTLHPTHSLLELAGLGAEIWQGIDPQHYVDQMRDEWEHRA